MIKVLREIDKNGKYVSRDEILYSIRFVKNDETLKSYEEENTLEIEDLDSYDKIFDIWNIRPITKEEETLEIYKSNPLYSSEYEYYDEDGNLIFYSSVPKNCSNKYKNNTYIKSGDIRCEITVGNGMFDGCTNLTHINLGDLPLVESLYETFYKCTNLTDLTITNLDSLTNAQNMFYSCFNLSLESCQMIANLLPDRSGDTSGTEYPLGVQFVRNWNEELTQICTNKGWTVYE